MKKKRSYPKYQQILCPASGTLFVVAALSGLVSLSLSGAFPDHHHGHIQTDKNQNMMQILQ